MFHFLFALALLLLSACASGPSLSPPRLPQIDALVTAKQLALRGEELLAQDDAAQATDCFVRARAICERVLQDEQNNALAHRIVGRTKLRQWPEFTFADATASLAAAKRSATTERDTQRAQDYLELVAGLSAYGDGVAGLGPHRRPGDQRQRDRAAAGTARGRDLRRRGH